MDGTCDDETTVARKTRTGGESLGVLVLVLLRESQLLSRLLSALTI